MTTQLQLTCASPESTQELGRKLGELLAQSDRLGGLSKQGEPLAQSGLLAHSEPLAHSGTTGSVILLTGELGAGKTQFTKGVAQALGITKAITSPTFNLMYEYLDTQNKGCLLRHFDLYRLEREEELFDIDYFTLLEDNAVSVVEWGDKFSQALPLDYLLIAFTFEDEHTRALRFEAQGNRSFALLEAFAGALAEALEGTPVGARHNRFVEVRHGR